MLVFYNAQWRYYRQKIYPIFIKYSTVMLLCDERYAKICGEITQFTKHRWRCCKKRLIKLTTVHLVEKFTRTGAWCSVPRARVMRKDI